MRREVAGQKIARAEGRLTEAAALFAIDADAFAQDVGRRDLAAFYLMLAIQECIDLASHWIAAAGWPTANDSGGCFDVIADKGGIGREVAGAMRGCVGIRNRIAHGYAGVDHARLHGEAPMGIAAARAFLAAAAATLQPGP